jgi:hypothetical protein
MHRRLPGPPQPSATIMHIGLFHLLRHKSSTTLTRHFINSDIQQRRSRTLMESHILSRIFEFNGVRLCSSCLVSIEIPRPFSACIHAGLLDVGIFMVPDWVLRR